MKFLDTPDAIHRDALVSAAVRAVATCISSLAWHSDAHIFTHVFPEKHATFRASTVQPRHIRSPITVYPGHVFSGTSNPDPASEATLGVF